jgi:AcrR family transcriptional regulator
MRADARKNYSHLLSVAREVIAEHGVDASMRDIARKANVGLATLLRHFPTRETLLEALLRKTLDELTQKAVEFETSRLPDDALIYWVREAVAFVQSYNGVVVLMAAALADTGSALYASCNNLRSAGARLLYRAQIERTVRSDLDGADLFALIGALGWLGDQPAFAPRADHIFDIITGAILTRPAGHTECLQSGDPSIVPKPDSDAI